MRRFPFSQLKRLRLRPAVALTLLLTLLLSIIAPLLHPSTAEAAWWADGGSYAKRKQLTITNNSTTTNLSANTTVAISVDTKALVDAGYLQSDCDDLRIVYQATDTTYTELTRYLVFPSGTTCSTSTATKVHFSLQASLAYGISTTLYYMYYSNPTASTPSSTDNAFDVGASDATLVCPFNGSTTCAAGETATTAGAIRYSGTKSALTLDGINDQASAANTASIQDLPSSDFTAESWIKVSTPNSTYSGFFSKGDWSSTGWGVISHTNRAIQFSIHFSTTDMACAAAASSYIYDTWTHFAFVFFSSTKTGKIYVNGADITSSCTAGVGTYVSDSAQSFYVGYTPYSYTKGIFDELRYSNTARYTGNFTPSTVPFVRDSNTKLLLHFDENGDDPRNTGKAIDDSGNANNGTITGAKYVAGLVGVDASSTNTGYEYSQTMAGHDGIFIEEGTTNKITNPSFDHATYGTNWTASGGTASENTTAPYYKFGSKSYKLVLASADNQTVLISIDAGNTNTHTLSAYVYRGTSSYVGSTVNATVAQLVYNGSAQTTTYTDMGGGWWRMTYSATAGSGAQNYGVQVNEDSGTLYIDGVQLEEKAYATTYTDGTLGTGYAWSGTAHESTSTRTAVDLDIPSAGNISGTAGTVSFWIKPTSATEPKAERRIFGTDCNWSTPNCMVFRTANGNIWALSVNDNSVHSVSKTVTMTANNWFHVVGTWDSSTGAVNLYINNSAATPGSGLTAWTPGSTLTFSYGGETGDATFSDLRIFSTALTSTQVADLYTAGLVSHSETYPVVDRFSSTKGQDPVLSMHMDEGQGTTAHDSSTYKNNGTISGATWKESGLCVSGRCLQFDGTDDTVTVANASSLSEVNTVGFWIKPISTTFSALDLDGGTHYISAASGVLSATGFTSPTIYVDGNASTTLSASKWQYVEVTTATSFAASAITIGKVSSTYFSGFIDELKLYPYARSAAQAKADFNGSYTARIASNSEALSEGLVGYWKMDEASWNGTANEVVDSSGNANHGVRSGDATTAAAKYGNGGTFDGTGDYVTVTSSTSLNVSTGITISAWVYRTAVPVGSYPVVLTKENFGASKGYIFGDTSAGSDTGFRFRINGDDAKMVEATLDYSQWIHYVATFDGRTSKIYKNTVLADSETQSSTTISTDSTNLMLGSSSYLGKMDDVRIYDRALSPAEVRQLYDWAPGPVAHWSTDEMHGQYAYDSSGSGNTGTLGASASADSADPTWANGKYGGGLSFDGGDYVSLGNNDIFNSSNIAIEAWVYHRTRNNVGTIVERGTQGSNGFYWLYIDTNGTLYFQFRSSGSNNATAGPTIPLNSWQHIVVVHNDGATVDFYLNGVKTSNTVTNTYSGATSQNIYIGAYGSTPNNFLTGTIDDVRIYNYARTSKQIVADMNASHPAVGSPVGSAIAYYKFDEGVDNTCKGGTNDVCNSGSGGSTLDGTVSGATRTDMGKFGKALSFDGTDDWVGIGTNSAIEPTTAITVSAWAKRATGTHYGRIVTNPSASPSYVDYDLRISPTAAMFRVRLPSGLVTATYTTSADSTWSHLVGTYDGSTVKVYLNGKLVNSQSGTGAIQYDSTYGETRIGHFGTGGSADDYYKGIIDEVKIYTYALTEDEVRTEYNHGVSMSLGSAPVQSSSSTPSNLTSGLVGYWKMDESSAGSGAVSRTDSSGNALTLTDNSPYAASGTGKFSNATQFVAANSEYLSIADNTTLSAGDRDFMLTAWVYMDTKTANMTIASKWSASGVKEYNLYYIQSTDRFSFQAKSSTDTSSVTASNFGSPSVGTWYFIVAWHNSAIDSINIQINTTAPNSTTHPGGVLDGATAFTVGSTGDPNTFWDGRVDELRFYNRILSPLEIEQLYNWAPGPVAAWKMDEMTGTNSYDTNGNGYNGSISGATWTAGKVGGALSFDGNNDAVTLPAGSRPTTAHTISFWLNPASWTNADYPSVFGGRSLGGIVGEGVSFTRYEGNVLYEISDGVGVRKSAGVATSYIPIGKWTHVTLIWDGSTSSTALQIYINGVLTSTGSASGFTTISWVDFPNFTIGYGYRNYYSGKVDDFKIYNYARSASQIAYDYNQGDPVAWYKFNECTGSTIHNAISTSYTGTWYGTGGGTQTSVGNCSTSGTAWGAGASGKYGASLNFDGTDDYVDAGDMAVLDGATETSVSAWVKVSDLTDDGVIISKDELGSSYVHLALWRDETAFVSGRTDTFSVIVSDGDENVRIEGATNASSDTNWHHIVFTFTGGKTNGLRMYIDGKEDPNSRVSTATLTALKSDSNSVLIGKPTTTASKEFTGQIDDVRIYNYALSPSQVREVYNQGDAVRFE